MFSKGDLAGAYVVEIHSSGPQVALKWLSRHFFVRVLPLSIYSGSGVILGVSIPSNFV